ncbi:radical SAM protein [Fusibacter paucivorans]|uniref:Radical SAM protein n=1 Tax=Fusibacter paucivorans TaxID=76009 RepID=A0ABS5PSW7_9FIRM|nr:radical SAM protein [Fusibacter paucivorans]MBS7527464.1 radical SAM protein [Fusibacter paucivorans]
MKTMMIIPVFIAHMGCGNACVFCNQRHISGHSEVPTVEAIKRQVDDYIASGSAETVGIAFYGGSFTGLDCILQEQYLSLAASYKKTGVIQHIRLSTRPDYIDERVLKRLENYDVDLVELGVQSFSDDVLEASRRGHNTDAIYRAIDLLKHHGIDFGIQLMFGLPNDTRERFFFSVRETIRLSPETVRIYPTLVLRDTALADDYKRELYQPPELETAVDTVATAYAMLMRSGVNVIRVGLQATDLIDFKGAVIAGPYHPAFKSLVMDRLVLRSFFRFAEKTRRDASVGDEAEAVDKVWTVTIHPSLVSHMRGHKHQNLKRLTQAFGVKTIMIKSDPNCDKTTLHLADDHLFEIYRLYDEEVTTCI